MSRLRRPSVRHYLQFMTAGRGNAHFTRFNGRDTPEAEKGGDPHHLTDGRTNGNSSTRSATTRGTPTEPSLTSLKFEGQCIICACLV